MAMIRCTECGKDMSDKAAACPNCGCPIEDIKARLKEIEAEQEEKNRAKEEEKKAKEVAAEVKRQKQEEARKAVTPEMKKKREIIGLVAAILVIAIGVGGWYFGIKLPQERAYQAYIDEISVYNEGIKGYNDAVNQYNDKAKEVIAVNDELDKKINDAQALVDCGDTPYEGEKITNLSNSIKEARNNKVETPALAEIAESIEADPNMEKSERSVIEEATDSLKSDLASYNEKTSSIVSDKNSLDIPDYTEHIEELTTKSKELEDSYAIQKQIMEPEEEWVLARLGRISDVANMAPVTEENDPNGKLNKAGGYTSTIYFGTPMLNTENLTGDALIDGGTDAGGSVETFKTVEDAESRNSYLGSFDGAGFMDSGSHKVLGTMVIRTSTDLKASQQETLTNAIVDEMISLE